MAVKPLALSQKAPKLGVAKGVPKVAGGVEPDAPRLANYRSQVSKLIQLGYEREEAEEIVNEQNTVKPPEPLAFAKGGLVGTSKLPKPKAVKVARMPASVKPSAPKKTKPAKVFK